jgi:hypothetical protein
VTRLVSESSLQELIRGPLRILLTEKLMPRSISLLVLTAAFVGGAIAAPPSKVFHRTVSLARGGQVDFHSERGTAHLTTWDRNEVDVFARIEADPDSRDPEESVRRTEIRFSATGNFVRIATDFGEQGTTWLHEDGDPRPHVSYEIRVPRTVLLQVRDNRSDIKIGNFWGHLTLDTDRSQVNVASLTGTIVVHADRGKIVIGRLALTDSSHFQTDRTSIDLGLASSQNIRLDLDLDRVSPSVEAGLLKGVIREDHHHTTYRGTAESGGPTLHVTADRGSLWLRWAQRSS